MEKEGKINRAAFCAARDFLESLGDHNNSSVSDAELSSLWKEIQDSIKTKSYRKIIYIGSIAASIMIMLLAIPYMSSVYQSRKQQDIMRYAQENSIQNNSKDIQV
ncbi:MAG: hypothetical protein LBU57_01100, partial [Dysgonamonadaceae bacterium]|nr:hypothetical protein [Dysgonamonadaceae bacterium]